MLILFVCISSQKRSSPKLKEKAQNFRKGSIQWSSLEGCNFNCQQRLCSTCEASRLDSTQAVLRPTPLTSALFFLIAQVASLAATILGELLSCGYVHADTRTSQVVIPRQSLAAQICAIMFAHVA